MLEKICRYFLSKLAHSVKIAIARDILDDIQKCEDYAIDNIHAEKIIESVIKSTGNVITDFIVKGTK